MPWSRDEVKALAEKILSVSRAEECEVTLDRFERGYTRFAAGGVRAAAGTRDLRITITSRARGRSGTVRVNEDDPAALQRAVERSEALMALAPLDPELVAGLGPQAYPEVPAWDGETAAAGAAERIAAVRAALDVGRAKKLEASGFFSVGASFSAIANKKGNFGFFRGTRASYSATMRTPDGTGSGWAAFASPRLLDIRAGDLATRAADKALASARPRDLAPGRYTVILEPAATEDLVVWLVSDLSARKADEGQSYLSRPEGGSRIGEKIFSDAVTVHSDPFDPRVPARPWAGGGRGYFLGFGGFGGTGFFGLPARRTTWIEKGVLRALPVDRYWAAKTRREPLPLSGGIVMEGGSGTVDDLVATTERGLLVTRFWYIRMVSAYRVELTGLTRDGVWLIEKGKVVAPVNNFRFNDSPVRVLRDVEAMGAAVSTGSAVVPPLRVPGFHFTSKSDAV